MKPIAEIFSQGEEVVGGNVVDSNAAWLSERLVALGFTVKRHTVVGDDLDDLKSLLREIAERADCCICTGGLGPTVDDLTAEAVAEAFARPLQLDDIALKQIQRYFSRRNRDMAESNRKQAYLPQGSLRIDNHWGTAPGFSLRQQRCLFFFVPGVPSEMKRLFETSVSASLLRNFSVRPDTLVTLRCIGIGESDLQQKLSHWRLPDHVRLGFRAGADEVQVKLLFPGDHHVQHIDDCVAQAADCLGDYVFVIDRGGQSRRGLVDVIAELMMQKNDTLSVLETASQGLIAAKCLGQPWLSATRYRRCLASLAAELDVSINQEDMQQTAVACARQLQQREGTELALVQLHSGASEQFGDQERSIILYNVLLTPDALHYSQHSAGGPPERKQNQAALSALDLLRRYLQNKCP
ncbi:CinA family nicotinamide mononucleotide deamidase-related protein [Methylomarinum sp. Ch1-1]|uniref:CinA family nicotinamide mononucleotide deamidase-related protein n=1 Tax=Methylomarinum roseum TaxID=3067653 RepID=A0AAU7NRZ9_9GAMM|nr:CinA family nicotinamide mononucleotide deamidase-related protein [Methylomarinum sp. Ch1-1]MDP4520309.1 CinA family nicotinamide mononucleotide deamidase-related protein [Methylomarinum sp. Ch1-1]